MTDDVEGWDDLFAPAPAPPDEAALTLSIPEDAWRSRLPETSARASDARIDEREHETPAITVPRDVAIYTEAEESALDDEDERLEDAIESGETEIETSAPDGLTLFGPNDDFRLAWQEWKGMPEFNQQSLAPYRTIAVHFTSQEGVDAFAALVGQKMPTIQSARGIWFPKVDVAHFVDKRYRSVDEVREEDR